MKRHTHGHPLGRPIDKFQATVYLEIPGRGTVRRGLATPSLKKARRWAVRCVNRNVPSGQASAEIRKAGRIVWKGYVQCGELTTA